MLSSIIRSVVAEKNVVIVLLVLLAGAVVAYLPRLNLDAVPDVTNVQVAINTEAPGLGAEEVEQQISFPIESVMYGLPEVAEVRSISKTGLSGVTIVFAEGVDIYFARQLVFERLAQAKALIPRSAGVPEMGPNTSGLGQVFQYMLVADEGSNIRGLQLRSLNDWVAKLLILPADGVTDVLSFGGKVAQYQIDLDAARLLAYEITQDEVMEAVRRSNANAGGWYLQQGNEQFTIRGTGLLSSGEAGLQQLRGIPVKVIDGTVIKVENLAKVKIGAEIRQGAISITHRDGEERVVKRGEVVAGIVLKRVGANTKVTIDAVKERLVLVQKALPEGVTLQPYYDQSGLIEAAVATVVDALLIAFALIVVILLLFLMNIRATLLVLISIPISIGIALLAMSLLGMSANLMSLGGLAVAIGMLVDGSVVIVENVVKRLQNEEQATHTTQEIIQAACTQVARPIFFASLIVMLVILPLYSFEGVEAKMFEPMASSILLAILGAMFSAFIFVPALTVMVFRHAPKQRKNPIGARASRAYQWCLRKICRRPLLSVVLLAVPVIAATVVVTPQIGTEFVPELEEGTINMRVTLAPSANLDTSIDVAQKLETMLLEFPEVDYALSRIGRGELGGDPEPVNNIEIYIGLKPVDQWTTASNRMALQAAMQKRLESHPGLLFNFSQPIATRVDELLSGVKAQLAIKLYGPDIDKLVDYGQKIETSVKTVSGTSDVAVEQLSGEPQIIVSPKRETLGRYGFTVRDVMSLVNDGVGGAFAGQIISGNERYDIRVRLKHEDRSSIEKLRALWLRSPTSAWVQLQDVAEVKQVLAPPQIRRDNMQRRVVIEANVDGRDMGGVAADINAAIERDVTLPAGYTVTIGGQFESQQRAEERLSIIVPITLLLIVFMLYLLFRSLKEVFVVLFSLPFALAGGIFALYATGEYLSVSSSVGFITLLGIAALNAVVLVERINELEEECSPLDAVVLGAASRLRPVLMTALTSALGLIPLLMSTGTGAEVQRPLATVIVGGLITSTMLTLLVIPALKIAVHRRS